MKKTWISLLVTLLTAVNPGYLPAADYHGQFLVIESYGKDWIQLSFRAEKCHTYQIIDRNSPNLNTKSFKAVYRLDACKYGKQHVYIEGLSEGAHFLRLVDSITFPCNCL